MTTDNNLRTSYFMHAGSQAELSREQLTGHVPSAYAEKAYSGTSGRYAFFPTDTVVEALRESGWAPVIAQEQRARAEDRFGFQKHLIRFHRREELGRAVLHDSRLELVLMNSHDGGCAFRLFAGVFRLVSAKATEDIRRLSRRTPIMQPLSRSRSPLQSPWTSIRDQSAF